MKTLTISDETYELIKDQIKSNSPMRHRGKWRRWIRKFFLKTDENVDVSELTSLVGKNWFFRTVTYHLVGKVKRIFGNFIVLEEASWIPDSGRFMQFIKNGVLNEVEPVGDVILNMATVVDFYSWKHELPQEQK